MNFKDEEKEDRQEKIKLLRDALTDARKAIESLDPTALGQDSQHDYYYRDELLANIDTALRLSQGEKEV